MSEPKSNPDSLMPERRRHLFFEYFLQFLMTFLGVSLGFLADNFRDQRAEDRTEQAYLVSLREDLMLDTTKLNFSIRTKAQKRLKLDTLVSFLTAPDRSSYTGRIYYLLRYATIREPFYGTEGTVRQLENAGGFRTLKNRALVRALNDYVSFRAKVTDIQEIRDAQSDQFKEAIARVADGAVINSMQDFRLNSGLIYFLRPPQGNPRLVSNRREDISALVFWVSNENSLESMLGRLHLDLKTTAVELISKINAELAVRD